MTRQNPDPFQSPINRQAVAQPGAAPVGRGNARFRETADLSLIQSFAALSPSLQEFAATREEFLKDKRDKESDAILGEHGDKISAIFERANGLIGEDQQAFIEQAFGQLVRDGELPAGMNPALIRTVRLKDALARVNRARTEALTRARTAEEVYDEEGNLKPFGGFQELWEGVLQDTLGSSLQDPYIAREIGGTLERARQEAEGQFAVARAQGFQEAAEEQYGSQVLEAVRVAVDEGEFKTTISELAAEAHGVAGLPDAKGLIVESSIVALRELARTSPSQAEEAITWLLDTEVGGGKLEDDPESLDRLLKFQDDILLKEEEKAAARVRNRATILAGQEAEGLLAVQTRILELEDQGLDVTDYEQELLEVAEQASGEALPRVREYIDTRLHDEVLTSNPDTYDSLSKDLTIGLIDSEEFRQRLIESQDELSPKDFDNLWRRFEARADVLSAIPTDVKQLGRDIESRLTTGDPNVDRLYGPQQAAIRDKYNQAILDKAAELQGDPAAATKLYQFSLQAKSEVDALVRDFTNARDAEIQQASQELSQAQAGFGLTTELVNEVADRAKFTGAQRTEWLARVGEANRERDELVLRASYQFQSEIGQIVAAAQDSGLIVDDPGVVLNFTGELESRLTSSLQQFLSTEGEKGILKLQAAAREEVNKLADEYTEAGQSMSGSAQGQSRLLQTFQDFDPPAVEIPSTVGLSYRRLNRVLTGTVSGDSQIENAVERVNQYTDTLTDDAYEDFVDQLLRQTGLPFDAALSVGHTFDVGESSYQVSYDPARLSPHVPLFKSIEEFDQFRQSADGDRKIDTLFRIHGWDADNEQLVQKWVQAQMTAITNRTN